MKFSVNVRPTLDAISGWISLEDEGKIESNIIIKLYHIHSFIEQTNCNIQRDDVKKAGLHSTGHCGFIFYKDKVHLKEGNFYKVCIFNEDKQIAATNLIFGKANQLRMKFNRFEILPRNDFSIMEAPSNAFFNGECDILDYKKLIIRLRRNKRAFSNRIKFKGYDYPHRDTDWSLFRDITNTYYDAIFQCFSTRSLWSVIDTFVDHAEYPENLAALAISNFMFQERFAQTLRCIYELQPKDKPIEGQLLYWGGMKTNQLKGDDAYDVFLTRNLECFEKFPLVCSFFEEILLRASQEKDSILGINLQHSKHFRNMFNVYKNNWLLT